MTGHPLAGVPEAVLLTAREALGAWEETDKWDDNVVCEIADAIVANLNTRGYITKPAPDPFPAALVADLTHVRAELTVSIDPPMPAVSDPRHGPTVINDHRTAHIPTDMVPIVAQVLARALADSLGHVFTTNDRIQAVTDA